jgi:hypothetical protein
LAGEPLAYHRRGHWFESSIAHHSPKIDYSPLLAVAFRCVEPGEETDVIFNMAGSHVFDAETDKAIRKSD